MRRAIAAAAVLAAASAAAVLHAPEARAHALLRSAEPAEGSALQQPPPEVRLTFTEEPDPALSEVRLLDASGTSFERGGLQAVSALTLVMGVSDLGEGVYTVSWRVFSKVDGHVTGGAFAFGVGVSPEEIRAADVPEPQTPAPSPLEVGGRWLLYVGLGLLVGAGWIGAWAFAHPPASVRRLLRIGWLVALGGLAAFGAAQLRASGANLGQLAGTSIGRTLIVRAVLVALAGLGALAAGSRRARAAFTATAAVAAGAVLVHASGGHAATGAWAWAKVGVHGVHFVAVGVWMGGLAALLAGVRGDPDTSKAASVRRYASAAAVMVFVVAGTGTFRAFNEIESWGQLVTTSYGRAVLAKVVLLGVVAGLAAVNRYRSLPVVDTDLRRLRRVSKAELTVAVVILAVTGLLSSLVPSRYDAGAAQTSSLVVQGTDFARTVAVRLEVTPGYPGANDFRAEVTDPADDAPLDADRVALRFRPPAEADLEGSTLELELVEQGTWEGTGADLSLGGVWRVVVLVGRGAGSAEVELTVATRCRTSVLRTPGQPSLHDIDLGAGAAVQAYVDPAEPGYVEVHFTFFDAGGDELPITGPLDIAAVRTDGDDVVRLETEVQRLTPGHYVGGVELTQGSWRFEVDATQQTSERFNACFEEAIG